MREAKLFRAAERYCGLGIGKNNNVAFEQIVFFCGQVELSNDRRAAVYNLKVFFGVWSKTVRRLKLDFC